MSYQRAQKFTFYHQTEPSWVVGERVVMFAPLPELPETPPAMSQFRSLSLEQYLNHKQQQLIRAVEQLFLELMKSYGQDCDHFEITLGEDGQPNGVIFTRPMDRVELAQIRSWRSQQPRPPEGGQGAPNKPAKHQERLPDPATLRPTKFAY